MFVLRLYVFQYARVSRLGQTKALVRVCRVEQRYVAHARNASVAIAYVCFAHIYALADNLFIVYMSAVYCFSFVCVTFCHSHH